MAKEIKLSHADVEKIVNDILKDRDLTVKEAEALKEALRDSIEILLLESYSKPIFKEKIENLVDKKIKGLIWKILTLLVFSSSIIIKILEWLWSLIKI